MEYDRSIFFDFWPCVFNLIEDSIKGFFYIDTLKERVIFIYFYTI